MECNTFFSGDHVATTYTSAFDVVETFTPMCKLGEASANALGPKAVTRAAPRENYLVADLAMVHYSCAFYLLLMQVHITS